MLSLAYTGLSGAVARSGERDLAVWNATCRLNPPRAAAERSGDPPVAAAHAAMAANVPAAMQNLAAHARPSIPVQARRHGRIPEHSRLVR